MRCNSNVGSEIIMKYIEFKDVKFSYKTENDETQQVEVNEIIDNLNLSVEKGDFVAVLGHNGSGKSTIAKLTNGILTPEQGTVTVDGISTSDEEKIFDIRQRVGMVFQNPDNQIVASIVEEDVAFGPENLGVEPKEIRQRVDDALKAVDMYEFRMKAPHKLSGGQKQRVAVAGIIAMKPDCIVLDEPTAMLDPSGRKEVMKTIKKLNNEGITIMLITHFMDEAVQASRVIVVNDGMILLDGTPREVFKNVELIKSVGLDVPQSTELVYQLEKSGIKLSTDVLNVHECIDSLIRALED